MINWLNPSNDVIEARRIGYQERDAEVADEIESLRAELESVEHEVAIVYDNLTCGKFSKCNTIAQYVIDAVDERHGIELAAKDKRIEELEKELNPDPEAHLMGWEGDDER